MNTTTTTTITIILAEAHVTYKPSILRRIFDAIAETFSILFFTKNWIESLTPEERAEMGVDLP